MTFSAADLQYFTEIAHTGNVSRAAERLNISQPSLSLAMQRLEKSVGASLLVRSKKGVSLTPAGAQLLRHARQLLGMWDGVRAAAQASVQEVQGVYSIGCHPSMARNIFRHFLPQLLAAHPGLEVRIKHDVSRRVTEDVVSLKTDLGIVVNPAPHPDLVIHKLTEDEVTFWARPDLPTANKDVLVCDPDLAQTQELLRRMPRAGLQANRLLTSSNLEVIAELTASGCGFGILPSKVAARAQTPLKRMPKAPAVRDTHSLIYRVENKNIRAVQTLAQTIRGCFKS
jgi:DNA-binding transcriptional LysR family regulator